MTIEPKEQRDPNALDINAIRITTPKRALLVEAMERQMRRGISPLMQEGYILSTVKLNGAGASQTNVEFALGSDETAKGAAVQPWESRLKINDAFYMTHMAIFFSTYTESATAATEQTNRAQARFHQFANTNVFGATNTPFIEAAYKGKFILSIDEVTFIQGLDMKAFQFGGNMQQGLAVSAAMAANTVDQSTWENERGWKQMTDPMLRFNGPANTKPSITFPIPIVIAGTNVGVDVHFYARGWKAANGGQFRAGNL